jgi:ribosomal protein S18 acetylase RimI-like enzyme
MASDELVARVFESTTSYFALGNEVIDGPLACFVRNVDAPDVYDANHATRVRASTPKEIDALLERADEVLTASGHRQFIVDPATSPTFEARLALDGYGRRDELVMLLEGELVGAPPTASMSIRRVESDDDWASVERLMRINHEREQLTTDVTRQLVSTKRFKGPALAFWLAAVKRTDCGYFSSWPGANGIGKVEDLFTHPDVRHRGVATALIRHSVDDARARGAKGVSISARVDDTPKDMYAAMGFRPLCVIRSWLKSEVG